MIPSAERRNLENHYTKEKAANTWAKLVPSHARVDFLLWAIETGDIRFFEKLIAAGYPLNASFNGTSLLGLALSTRQFAIAHTLIVRGVELLPTEKQQIVSYIMGRENIYRIEQVQSILLSTGKCFLLTPVPFTEDVYKEVLFFIEFFSRQHSA